MSREKDAKRNLDLAKILIALDNLYFKCSESGIRIKHDYQEFKNDKQAKKNKKKQDDKKKKEKEQLSK